MSNEFGKKALLTQLQAWRSTSVAALWVYAEGIGLTRDVFLRSMDALVADQDIKMYTKNGEAIVSAAWGTGMALDADESASGYAEKAAEALDEALKMGAK